MSIDDIRRRDFLALTLAVLLAPARLSAEPAVRRNTYEVDIGILYHMLTFHLEGSFDERVDRGAGRYEVRGAGQGSGIANRLESSGVLRNGRWAPVRGAFWFTGVSRRRRSSTTTMAVGSNTTPAARRSSCGACESWTTS